MKEFAKKFYASKRWHACRRGYISQRLLIDGGLCEVCHEEPGYILHHRVLLTESNINNPEVSLNWDNLKWECKACHDLEEGHFKNQNNKRINALFDDKGNPIDIRIPETNSPHQN